jgi:hypothetical protein
MNYDVYFHCQQIRPNLCCHFFRQASKMVCQIVVMFSYSRKYVVTSRRSSDTWRKTEHSTHTISASNITFLSRVRCWSTGDKASYCILILRSRRAFICSYLYLPLFTFLLAAIGSRSANPSSTVNLTSILRRNDLELANQTFTIPTFTLFDYYIPVL